MSLEEQIAARKKLYDIDDAASALGRETLKKIGGTVAQGPARFRARAARDPFYRDLIENHFETLEKCITEQLDTFLTEGMSSRYFELLNDTVDHELKTQVGGRFHIAMAIHTLEVMFEAVGRDYPVMGSRMAARCTALMRLMFMDAFNAITIDQERLRAATDKRAANLDGLAGDFRMAVDEVSRLIGAASERIDAAASETSGAIRAAVTGAEDTASQIERTSGDLVATAAAAEELSMSIEEIDRAANTSLEAVRNAVDRAGSAEEQINSLVDAVKSIGSVAGLISEIADQTNLLALNATIEAARAGEAGRGFAVVAQEVKSLAAQTARATQDIGSRIAVIEEAVARSAGAIGDVSGRLDEVSHMAGTIGAAVSQQKVSTEEIARMMQGAVDRTSTIVSASMQMRRTIEDSAGSSGELQRLARELNVEAESFASSAVGFLDRVRAV